MIKSGKFRMETSWIVFKISLKKKFIKITNLQVANPLLS